MSVETNEWSAGLTLVVAGKVREYRRARRMVGCDSCGHGCQGMSARQLSEACGELGYPIPRKTISDLENGRRSSITVSELFILSRALGVSLADLLPDWPDVCRHPEVTEDRVSV